MAEVLPAHAINHNSPSRIGLVGDDLTGIAAVAGSFVERGFRCRVHTCRESSGSEDGPIEEIECFSALALMTDSRHASQEIAEIKVRNAVQRLKNARSNFLFKKIDSLLRGPVGAEIRAVSETLPGQTMVIAAAAPSSGRITRMGVQMRTDNETGTDQGSFIRARPDIEHIPTLLAQACACSVTHVSVAELEIPNGLASIAQKNSGGIIVCDAESPEHLRIIAKGAIEARVSICAGSSEFAGFIAEALAKGAIERPVRISLVICGSASSIAHGQLAVLQKEGRAAIAWITPGTFDANILMKTLGRMYDYQDTLILAVKSPDTEPVKLMPEMVTEVLTAAAAIITRMVDLKGIVVTGGDTAAAIMNAMGIDTLEPVSLLEFGIPLLLVRGGEFDGMPIVTKPGAYGDAKCLVRLVKLLAVQKTLRISRARLSPY